MGWIPPDEFLALSLSDRKLLVDALAEQAKRMRDEV